MLSVEVEAVPATTLAVEVDAATVLDETVAAVAVPFCAIAMDWKAACVLLAVGLMLNTIPFPQ